MNDDSRPILLVIDDDHLVRRAVSRTLTAQGFHVLTAGDGPEGLGVLSANEVDVAIIDIGLPGMDGLEVLRQAQAMSPLTECIILTGQGNISTAYASLDAGASDYFEKPIHDWQRFQQVLRRATQVRRLKRERRVLTKRFLDDGPRKLIGNSRVMQELRELIAAVSKSSASILIHGESGTGKELVGEAIHRESGKKGQFVRINCASFPADLMEGELFGWEKGAHSTATQSKPGLFEVAQDGTILLDEIGEMPFDLQAKLLRVLEGRTIRRLGGTRETPVNARVVASTNRDLSRAVKEGRFRQDLFFRINVIQIRVPPLRDRKDDIALLTYNFIQVFNEDEARGVRRVSADFLERLERYEWPGNVRELRNLLHRAVLLAEGEELSALSLEGSQAANPQPASVSGRSPGLPDEMEALFHMAYADAKREVVGAFTAAYLRRKLGEAGGNITRAADASDMLRPNFKRLMRRHSVDVPKETESEG